MISTTIEPGQVVWVLDEYQNVITEKTVKAVASVGIAVKDHLYPIPFGCLFETQGDAVQAMLTRAANKVALAEHALQNKKAALARLERKYAKAGPVTRPAPATTGATESETR